MACIYQEYFPVSFFNAFCNVSGEYLSIIMFHGIIIATLLLSSSLLGIPCTCKIQIVIREKILKQSTQRLYVHTFLVIISKLQTFQLKDKQVLAQRICSTKKLYLIIIISTQQNPCFFLFRQKNIWRNIFLKFHFIPRKKVQLIVVSNNFYFNQLFFPCIHNYFSGIDGILLLKLKVPAILKQSLKKKNKRGGFHRRRPIHNLFLSRENFYLNNATTLFSVQKKRKREKRTQEYCAILIYRESVGKI